MPVANENDKRVLTPLWNHVKGSRSMDTHRIIDELNRLFSAQPPEFYRRHLIFWQDEDREFESLLDEISIPNVTILKITGTNYFAVKKLLLHDDLAGNYLIYNPIADADPQENWLLDIEKFSEIYRADFISMLMNELHIEASLDMRKTVKLYAKFFDSKERTEKLKRIGREYQKPLQLHTDIMAVLAGLNGGSAQDVFIAVLSDDRDEAHNAVLRNIQKFGNCDAFWQLVQKYTGYCHVEGTTLDAFAAHVLLTALAQTMNPSVLKGLEKWISHSNTAYCYSLVHEWRHRENNEALWELCRDVEQAHHLVARFEKQEIETLLTADIFPAIQEVILSRFFTETADHVVKTSLMLKTSENRRTSGWIERFRPYYDCLYYIAQMQNFYQENAAGFHIAEPKALWKFYAQKAYEMDSFYRHFHTAFSCALKDSHARLEDKLKHAADYIEGLYQNWFLKELNDSWTQAISDDLAQMGYISEIDKQRDFYARYVKPLAKKNTRAFVILSDALRYEVAAELRDAVVRSTKGTATLETVQAVFPSITKFGMAALLPGLKLSVNANMDALVEDMPTRSTDERQKILCVANPNSVAISAIDVMEMKRDERRKRLSGKEVVYIYHNAIDAIGDKAPTEKKVFEACEEAIQEISSLLRIIVNELQGTDIFITADHGFLYTYSPLTEGDKLSKDAIHGQIYEIGRRYALTESAAEADYLMPVRLEKEIRGMPVKGFTPFDATRIRISGGGENYVHGGISLQELVVPVIRFKNQRTTSKNFVEVSDAELTLLSVSRKISNLLFSLDFFQRQPVGDKIQPCTYTLYMTDEDGDVVSDRQTVIADSRQTNASERVYRVRFSLKAGVYDRNKIYRLVIANATGIPEEIEFHIDIAFADDFGFDL